MLEVRIRKKCKWGILDVRLDADRGSYALLGERDDAMRMTLRCIAGLETPDEGRIALDNVILYDSIAHINLPPARRRVGYLFPGGALFPTMTIEQNLRLALQGGGRELLQTDDKAMSRPAVIDAKVNDFLRRYHLDGLGGMLPRDLSEAQQRQAAYARLMAGDPRLVLLEDTFAALEGYRKGEVLREVREDLESRGLQGVLTTTDLDEAYAFGDVIAAIRGGKSEPVQKRADFFDHPATLQAAILGGCRNLSEVRRIDEFHALVPAWGTLFCFRDADGVPVRLPAGLKAIGIKERDLLTTPPLDAEGRKCKAYKFSVYRPVMTETRVDREVQFCPCRRGEGRLVWTVPKTQMDAETVMDVRRLYVRNEDILLLS